MAQEAHPAEHLTHPVETFELVLLLIVAVIALHWLANRLRLPPAAALMVGGGALAFLPGIPEVSLDPELALVLFLPPLLMDGAYYTAFGRFRRHLPGIISLAVGAVLFTTLAVGVVTKWLLPELPWAACFALGAIVSPPDAISARAVLARVKLPRRLQALLEGESLLNDATGLVLFRFAVVATLSGTFDAGAAVGDFAVLALGGVAVGAAIGVVWITLFKRLGDDTLKIAASCLLGWVAYIAGEAVHVSGVISTVTAGILLGWFQHVIFSASVRLRGNAFWQVMVFALEALVFILIGFSLRGVFERAGDGLAAMVLPVGAIVLTVIAARFVWVFGNDGLLAGLRGAGVKQARPLGWRQATVLSWAGMRGVVTLAVALSLPAEMPGRDLMLVAACAVILATVIVQGISLGWLIRHVAAVDADPKAPLSLPAAEREMTRAMTVAVEREAHAPDGTLIHPQLLDLQRRREAGIARYAELAEDENASRDGLYAHFNVRLAAVAAGRAELIRLHRAGQIEDEVLHNLERDLDLEEMAAIFQTVE